MRRLVAKHLTALAGASLAVLTVVGCQQQSQVDSPDAVTREFFRQVATDATAGHASAEQMDVIERAAAAGSVTYADVAQLVPSFRACIEDSGGVYVAGEDQPIGPGLAAPTYSVGVPGVGEDAALAMIEHCERTHLEFVLGALWTQPSTIEARDKEFAERLPEIERCLRDQGVTFDEGATVAELQVLVQDLAVETGIACYVPSWF